MFSALSREAMGVVLHKDSKWYQQWKDFKDNNVVFNSKCSKDKGVAHYFPCSDSCCVGSNAICASSLNIMQIIAIFFFVVAVAVRWCEWEVGVVDNTAAFLSCSICVWTPPPVRHCFWSVPAPCRYQNLLSPLLKENWTLFFFFFLFFFLVRSTLALGRSQGMHAGMSPGRGQADFFSLTLSL